MWTEQSLRDESLAVILKALFSFLLLTGLSCPDFKAGGPTATGWSRIPFPVCSGCVARGCRAPHQPTEVCEEVRSFDLFSPLNGRDIFICHRLLKTWGLHISCHPSSFASKSNTYILYVVLKEAKHVYFSVDSSFCTGLSCSRTPAASPSGGGGHWTPRPCAALRPLQTVKYWPAWRCGSCYGPGFTDASQVCALSRVASATFKLREPLELVSVRPEPIQSHTAPLYC